MTEKFYYKSPIGILEIELKNDTIQRLRVVESCSKISERTGYFAEVVKQLDEYFAGRRKEFDIPLHPVGTDFQLQVWRALLHIPYGETRSYKEIAKMIGNEKAVRAVAHAIGANGIDILIPCHRVVGSNHSLTGFAGGLDRKEHLLKLEGHL